MSIILIIETGSSICSVAIARDGQCAALLETGAAGSASSQTQHSSILAPYIAKLLEEHGPIDAVAVSAGPGSYTGLRIGLSTAKGLCYAAAIPLLMIDSLTGLVEAAGRQITEQVDFALRPMVDARRMEVFTAKYDAQGNRISDIEAVVVDHNSFLTDRGKRLYVFGSGAAKTLDLIGQSGVDAHLLEIELSARWLCSAAQKAFDKGEVADTAYAEPLYVKEWQSTTVKK